MEIGVALPSTVRDTSGDTLVEWAAEADKAGFSSVAALGRLVYDESGCSSQAPSTLGVSCRSASSAT